MSEPKPSGIESSLPRSSETSNRSLTRTVVSFLFCGTIPRFLKMGLLDMDFLDDVRRMNPRQVNNHNHKHCRIISCHYKEHRFNKALFNLTYAGSPRFLWTVFVNEFLLEPGNIWCRLITRTFNQSHVQISCTRNILLYSCSSIVIIFFEKNRDVSNHMAIWCILCGLSNLEFPFFCYSIHIIELWKIDFNAYTCDACHHCK